MKCDVTITNKNYFSKSCFKYLGYFSCYDIIYLKKKKIEFIDLLTNKWFEFEGQCLVMSSPIHVIDGKENYIYFIKYNGEIKE